tara:strand:- start:447 stop:1199 length:753 start_codon:yes stop_codon:yes gene_type:complete
MLKRNFLIVLIIISYVCKGNDDAYHQFEKGNSFYTSQEFDSALIAYKKVLKSKMISKELYLNLGNTFFKLDSIPQAILFYEKGIKLAPGDADLSYNLQYCNKLIKDKNPIKKSVLLNELIFSFLGKSPNYWAYSSIILLGLVCVMFAFFRLSVDSKWKKINFYSGIIVLILFGITVLLSSISKSKINETKYGIVIKNSIKVRTEPSENASTAFLLHEGSKAKVTAEINEWIEISFNEKKGWIRTNALERI